MKLVRTGIFYTLEIPLCLASYLDFLRWICIELNVFLSDITPLLLTGSLIEKVWRQEPQLVEIFGDEYIQYQKVPLFIPWIYFFPRRKNK